MSAADPEAALADYLKSTAAGTLAVGRVYRPELDTDEIPNMPQTAIVIRHAGGYALFGGANIPVGDPRLDIFCYGQTFLTADKLAREVVNALKALRSQVHAGTRLMWARIEGGPTPLPGDPPETRWPCNVVTAQVAHCEVSLV